MKNAIRQIFLFALLVWCAASVYAEGIHDKLPAEFVKIAHLEDITEDGFYAIGGLAQTGDVVFLSSHLLQNNKMKGVSAQSSPRDKFTFRNPAVIWTLRKLSSENYALISADEQQYLTRRKPGALGMTLTKSETKACEWRVETASDGRFYLKDPANSSNVLSVSTNYYDGGEEYYFDNYRIPDSKEVYIYKLPTKITDIEGQNRLPENGQHLALWNNGRIRSISGNGVTADEAELCDGSIAPVSAFEVLTAELKGENKFALRTDKGYLDYHLQSSSHTVIWQILNGHICTDEDQPRYLCYDEARSVWKVMEQENAKSPAAWIPVADAPSRCVDANGVCTLGGGWTASSLASLSWAGIRCLDLTHLALPLQARSFSVASETSNLPIFVNASMVEYIPQSWNFVVSCGANNTLLRNTRFMDGEPFFTDRTFSVAAGQLVYERQNCTPGVWNTLCLPFAWTADDAYIATLTENSSEAIYWKSAANIAAGMPAIVSPFKGNEVRVVSEAGNIMVTPKAENGFYGTFVPLHVKSSAENIYMLDKDGKTFIHTAPGSTLAPYRAYIQPAR